MASKFSLESILTLTDNVAAPLKAVQGRIQGFAKKIKRTFGGLNNTIGKLNQKINKGLKIVGLSALLALSAGTAAATAQFIEFDDSIRAASAKFKDIDVRSADYQKTLKQLGQTARDVAAVTEFTAVDTAGALDKMAMAGLSSKLSMSLLAGTTDLATAAGTDLTTAVDIATDSLGAFGLMTNDAAQATINLNRISDVFAKTTTTANTSLTDLFEAAKTGAPAFTAAGQSIESFSALAGVMANSGVKGSEAGTSLRNTMLRLADATPQAQKVMNSLGVSIKDQQGNFRDIIDILGDFEKGLQGMGTAERTAALSTVFGARAVTGINILLQEGTDSLKEYRDELINSAGASKTMADTMRKSLRNQINVLKSSLMELGFRFVEAFEENASDSLGSLIDVIRSFDPTPVINFLKSAINFGIGFYNVFKPLTPLILGLIVAIKLWAVAQAIINAVMWASPITIIIGGIIALIAIIILLVSHWKTVKEWIGKAWEAFLAFAQGIIDTVIPYITSLGQTLMTYLLTPINLVMAGIIKLLDLLAKLPGKAGDSFKDAANAVKGFQEDMNKTLTGTERMFDFSGNGNIANQRPDIYANPETRSSESRSYKETVSRNEVYVRPDRGTAISRKPGGPPETTLAMGTQ